MDALTNALLGSAVVVALLALLRAIVLRLLPPPNRRGVVEDALALVDALQEQVDRLQTRVAAVEADNQRLTSALSVAQTAATDVESLRRENAWLRGDNNRLHREVDDLRRRVNDLQGGQQRGL